MMTPRHLSDEVWLLKGLVASEAGTLTLMDARLRFITDELIFDCPLTELEAVKFPWYHFGAGCTLKIKGAKYKLSFIQPGNTADGQYASIPDARRKGRRWKTALTQAGPR